MKLKATTFFPAFIALALVFIPASAQGENSSSSKLLIQRAFTNSLTRSIPHPQPLSRAERGANGRKWFVNDLANGQ